MLKNQIALVTAATRGIGLAAAKTLSSHGAKVYLAVRRLEAGRQLAGEMENADVVYFNADEPETYSAMVEEVGQKEGRLDILVNNFGSTDVTVDRDVAGTNFADFLSIVEQNLRSVYVPVQAALPYLQKGGAIVNISSVGGRYADVSRTAYGVSKAAINFLTQCMAVQLASRGVRCNAVLPGFIATDASLENMPEAFLRKFLTTVPLSRPGEVQDIANAVLYLASPMSAFVTGELLAVSGGFGVASPMYPLY